MNKKEIDEYKEHLKRGGKDSFVNHEKFMKAYIKLSRFINSLDLRHYEKKILLEEQLRALNLFSTLKSIELNSDMEFGKE